jgi:superoxide dismutase, Cu-Zn family
LKISPAVIAVAALVAGSASMAATEPSAVADLAPTAGNGAKGQVTFTAKGGKVVVTARVSGLAPGPHGFHVHEKGDCSAADGMSAGGHFNPHGKGHGSHSAAEHHAGDLPMLDADAAGNATLTAELDGVSIGSGPTDLVGRSVVVHKDADDFKTQPTGSSGARVACGVIRKP